MVISANQFSDVSNLIGIDKVERTWGANWVDFNGDTLPDIYVSNHQDFPSLYLNQGDGTFEDIAPGTFPFPKRDNHGGAWADFDNDGDADLMQVAGGATGILGNQEPRAQSVRHQLYVNDSGQFVDRATELGVAYPLNRGRTPLWVDINKDGKLDLSLSGAVQRTGAGKSTIFQQTDNKFVDVGSDIGFTVSQSPFGFLADLSGNDDLELNIVNNGRPRLAVYDYINGSLINKSFGSLKDVTFPGARDIAAADFNGDLITDLYFAKTSASVNSSAVTVDELGRVAARLKGTRQTTATAESLIRKTDELSRAAARLTEQSEATFQSECGCGVCFSCRTAAQASAGQSEEPGYSFKATSDVTFDFFLAPPLQPDKIFIGSKGIKAENFDLDLITREGLFPGEWQLTLSPKDARTVGIPPKSSRQNKDGLYIGYDPSKKRWTTFAVGDTTIDVVVSQKNNKTFTDVEPINFDNSEFKNEDTLLFGNGEGFVDRTDFSNINSTLNAATNVVAGDFDNDMDIDIYVVTSEPTENTPNILYENQGNGKFRAVENSAGARGTKRGRADAVVVGDYDLDGFLDLFITNGAWPPLLAEEGPHQLLKNKGNGNHWLEIDLEGVVTNRDGIGAKVYVTAGGVTQVREQSGGMHLYSQNHQRLHFGLAKNSTVEKILVVWPDGRQQEVTNVAADQLIKIVEDPQTSFDKGAPAITGNNPANNAPGVYLWKETIDGPYKLRTVGTPGKAINYTVDLIAHEPLKDVQPIKLNSGDRLTESDYGFSLDSTVEGFQDGVDFQLEAGTTALLSVTQDGVANPRQLYVGRKAGRLAPSGWILDSKDLPKRPDFTPGNDLGLFVGQGKNSSTVEFRWNSDGSNHRADLNVLTSAGADFQPVRLSAEDRYSSGDNEAKVDSRIRPGFDGLDVELSKPLKIGFTYDQDDMNQPHRVNRSDASLGFQNAYELPVATPYGKPDYNSATDRGLFLWKDEESDLWKLRVTAGGRKFSRYKGKIVADQLLNPAKGISVEANDILGSSKPTEINFDFKVSGRGEDGIDFRLPLGASAELNLGANRDRVAQLVNVGAEQWAVSALPLDLSGWDTQLT